MDDKNTNNKLGIKSKIEEIAFDIVLPITLLMCGFINGLILTILLYHLIC